MPTAQFGSFLASRTPKNQAVNARDSSLAFHTYFAGSFLSPYTNDGSSASYHQFTQLITGNDPLTNFSWDTSLQKYYGAGYWRVQSLTDFLGDGTVNIHNVAAYIGAYTVTIPNSNGQQELVVDCKQRNGSPGDPNPPQCLLLYQRFLVGDVRAPDVPEVFYEWDGIIPNSLPNTLVTPSVGGSSNWYTAFEIKAGMCNNGIGGPDTAGAGDWRFILGYIKDYPSNLMKYYIKMDDGANSSSPYFDIPGVNPLGQPRRTIRERFMDCPKEHLGQLVKFRVYLKRPTTNLDRTSGICYVSATPYSTGVEFVMAKWIGGEQIGVQDGPMERFFINAYSNGYAPWSHKIRNLYIYKSWVLDQNILTAPMNYLDATAYCPFTYSMKMTYGGGATEFGRDTIATVFDNEDKLITVKTGTPRLVGARYVQNLFINTTTLAMQSVSIENGRTYTVSFSNLGTISFSGAYTGSALNGVGVNTRVQKTFTATSTGSVLCTVSGTVSSAQFEDVTGQADTTASEYVSHGTEVSPYYHGMLVDGTKCFNTNKDGSSIPNSKLKGLQLNPFAVTNTALWCRDFTNAVWSKSNVTVNKNQNGIDNKSNSACLLTATSSNATVLQSITASASAGCFSIFIKRSSGTGTIEITRDGGSSWTDITSQINNTTFTQVAIENTSVLNPNVGIRMGTSGDAIIVDYAQNELGIVKSMPIYTEAASAQRFADIARIYKTDNSITSDSLANTGFWVVTVEKNWTLNNGSIAGDSITGIFTSSSNSGVIAKDGTNSVNGPTGIPSGQKKIGMRYSGSSLEAFSDGNWSSAGSFDGQINFTTYIEFGKEAACTIRDFAIWNQVNITNAQALEIIS